MPIYEYQCPDCGHRFEKLQKMSEDPVTDCPECHGTGVRKLVSQAAFILKGGGWYKDHYGLKKSGGESKPAGEGSAPAAPAAGGDSAAPASSTSAGSTAAPAAAASPAASGSTPSKGA